MNTLSVAIWEVLRSTPLWVTTGFATGLIVSCCGAYASFRSLRYRFWTATEGEITESRLKKRRAKDKYGCQVYDPAVGYTYQALGRAFTSQTVTLHRTCRPKQKGAMLNVYYPVGKRVTVYHHPRRPEVALLQPAQSRPRLALAVAGLLVMTAFAAMGPHHVPGATQVAQFTSSPQRG